MLCGPWNGDGRARALAMHLELFLPKYWATWVGLSVLRTIELILNLRPMTVFDFAARSLAAAFVSTPNNAPYSAEPAN